jgi:hypothetical protein
MQTAFKLINLAKKTSNFIIVMIFKINMVKINEYIIESYRIEI